MLPSSYKGSAEMDEHCDVHLPSPGKQTISFNGGAHHKIERP